MSVRSSVVGVVRRLPFGIGAVVMLLSAAMVVCVGAVLAIGTPEPTAQTRANGELRDYPRPPREAWTISQDTLPGYSGDAGPDVVDDWQDQWLVAYPAGLGRAFLLIDRLTGDPIWTRPVIAGLGDCAFTNAGQVGCAVKLGSVPSGFYLIDSTGTPGQPTELDDTAKVVGVGPSFLRIDQGGYRVTMRTPSGRQLWSRTFASVASATVDNGTLVISTLDGGQFVVDPDDGRDRVTCQACSVTSYPSGIAVQHNDSTDQKVTTYATSTRGVVAPSATSESVNLRLVPGPSTLPVLTGIGSGTLDQTQGRYEVRDPARTGALWQVTDPELSKTNTKPCGALVALGLKDGSHVVKNLTDGTTVGRLPVASYQQPDANIDYLECVGSFDSTLVFANNNQITAFDAARGEIAWTRAVVGAKRSVEGYLVIQQGTSLTVLQPG